MFHLSFTEFNLIEGAFWCVCAVAALAGARLRVMPPGYWKVLCGLFILFGLSDFVEAYYPISFLEPAGWWLLAWKAFCVIGFVLCAAWYLRKRAKKIS